MTELIQNGQMRCRNFLCRQFFSPSKRFPRSKYCTSCTIDQQLKKQQKKAARGKTCKNCKNKFTPEKPWARCCSKSCENELRNKDRQAALARKKERQASRRRKKSKGGAYPNKGFADKRKQMKLFETVCAVTGITAEEHLRRFHRDLHLDHIIPARIANDANGDPHNDVNMIWLSHSAHAVKLAAEEFLRRARPYDFVLELKKHNWPMERLKAAMKYYQMYSENFPWGDSV